MHELRNTPEAITLHQWRSPNIRDSNARAGAAKGAGMLVRAYRISMADTVAASRLALNESTYWPALFAVSVHSQM